MGLGAGWVGGVWGQAGVFGLPRSEMWFGRDSTRVPTGRRALRVIAPADACAACMLQYSSVCESGSL